MGKMKTLYEEVLSRLKTLGWSALWVGLTFFVDGLSQAMAGLSLPDLHIAGMTINTAVVLGLVINQVSKFLHNKNAGEVRMP